MSFVCPRCRRESFHPRDEEEGYCGACHRFTGRELEWWRRTFGDTEPDWPWIDAMTDQLRSTIPQRRWH